MTVNQKCVVLDGVALSMCMVEVVFQHNIRSFIYLLLKLFNILNQSFVNQRGIKFYLSCLG